MANRAVPLFFIATPPQDLSAPEPGIGGQFLRCASLTDARLSNQHDQPAPPGKRVFQASLEATHLPLAPHEHAAC